MSVGPCIALLKAEVERKLTSALIIFSACPRFESCDPALVKSSNVIQFGRRWTRLQTALPQLQARERAAHTGIISEQCF